MRDRRIYSSRFPWRAFFKVLLFFAVAVAEICLAPTHGLVVGGLTLLLLVLSIFERFRHLTDDILDLARWVVGRLKLGLFTAFHWSKRFGQFCKNGVRRLSGLGRSIDALRSEGVAPHLKKKMLRRVRHWLESTP